MRSEILIVQNPLFGIIIAVLTMQTSGTITDTKWGIVQLELEYRHVKIRMILEGDGGEENSTYSEDFSLGEEESSDAEASVAKEDPVLAVWTEATVSKTNSTTETSLPAKRLAYLDGITKQQITNLLVDVVSTAEGLHELRLAQAPFKNRFELFSNIPVHEIAGMLPLYRKYIVKDGLKKIFTAKLLSSSWLSHAST